MTLSAVAMIDEDLYERLPDELVYVASEWEDLLSKLGYPPSAQAMVFASLKRMKKEGRIVMHSVRPNEGRLAARREYWSKPRRRRIAKV